MLIIGIVKTDKDFATWYRALSGPQRTAYARRAKTTLRYIEAHLLAPYKIPRPGAMNNLAKASDEFTVGELATWFYEKTLARKQTTSSGRPQ